LTVRDQVPSLYVESKSVSSTYRLPTRFPDVSFWNDFLFYLLWCVGGVYGRRSDRLRVGGLRGWAIRSDIAR
jgi:hypothetical protein